MKKITVVIPTESRDGGNAITQSFRDSPATNFLHAQFVVLVNEKKAASTPAERVGHDTYEIIKIYSDRYFGSCEENIYRVQDFSEIFEEYVFFVGGHDLVDWNEVSKAVTFAKTNELDACGWNILHGQRQDDGSFSSAPSLKRVASDPVTAPYLDHLYSGGSLPANVAFPLLISTFGPVDWAAYLGSHIFKRATLQAILRYKFSEFIYSFVFKQLTHFASSQRSRYGLYMGSAITRLGDEFLREAKQNHSRGWLESHRLVVGGSPFFPISLLNYLANLSDELFLLVANSFCYSHVRGQTGEIDVLRHPTLRSLLKWSVLSMRHSVNGKSHILGGQASWSALFEIEYVYQFLIRWRDCWNKLAFKDNGEAEVEIERLLAKSIACVSEYLQSDYKNQRPLRNAIESLTMLRSSLDTDLLIKWHISANSGYLTRI
jgi:hypothetical protein